LINWTTPTYFGNPALAWAEALLLSLAIAIVLDLLKRWSVRHLGRVAQRTSNYYDDLFVALLRSTQRWLLIIISLYIGSYTLMLSVEARTIVDKATFLALLLQVGVWIAAAVTLWTAHYQQEKADDGTAVTMASTISFITKLAVWSIVILVALDNLNVKITALVTGLGIGALAVSLALQNILTDLFASLSILFDRPFVIGDFIVVDDFSGTVEHIGLKTTRMRSLSGEQVIFANADLLQSRIRNYKLMKERRVVFSVGVTYDTPYEKLKEIPTMLEKIISTQKIARFDRAHFKAFNDSSLDFEIVYYVTIADYKSYMDIQQAINLETFRRFAEEGIEFAYPTQTIFLQQ